MSVVCSSVDLNLPKIGVVGVLVFHWFYIPLSPGKAGSSWERVVLLAFRRNLDNVVTYQATLGRMLSKQIYQKKSQKANMQPDNEEESSPPEDSWRVGAGALVGNR